MKKILAISVLVVFLFGSTVHYILFKYIQVGIRKEVKTMIRMNQSDKELTIVKIPLNQKMPIQSSFRWKNKSEFWYKGNLYDLVKQKTINDTIYYYCINDKQEEKLYANLDEQVRNNSEQQNAAKSLAKIITTKSEQVYFFQHFERKIENNIQKIKFRELFSFYRSQVVSPPTPPPKV